jgi:hypothetical protein
MSPDVTSGRINPEALRVNFLAGGRAYGQENLYDIQARGVDTVNTVRIPNFYRALISQAANGLAAC